MISKLLPVLSCKKPGSLSHQVLLRLPRQLADADTGPAREPALQLPGQQCADQRRGDRTVAGV